MGAAAHCGNGEQKMQDADYDCLQWLILLRDYPSSICATDRLAATEANGRDMLVTS
jgi:hypothetical protein